MSPTTRRLAWLAALASLLFCASSLAAAPTYTITATAFPTDGGSVALSPSGPYQKNNIVVVTANPSSGVEFDHWEGDLSGTENPTRLRVSRNHTVTAIFVTPGGGGGSGGTDPGVTRPPLPDAQLVVGYFTQWSIYRRNYLVRDVESSGAAAAMNVINYAFAAPDANLRCASLDTFADFGKRFDASESVDGVADTVSQPLKGNFNQLLKLKQIHPQLRVLISLGGWTQSFRFSDVAQTAESRATFVASCIDMFMRGNVAPGINAAGVFDGIDVDWEYPGSCGETCSSRPTEDVANFTALLQEFRKQLDDYENEVRGASNVGPEFLLTIAGPAGAANYGPIELGAIHDSLDWINIMAYDFHGSWEPSGPANHHAALHLSSCEPTAGDWGDKAVAAYLDAGIPPDKLLLGVPFYGRGWRGVSPVNDGLCQPASGVPRGVYEKGINDFEVLDAQGRSDFWDDETATHWTFNGSEFWSYDDARSLGVKAGYVNEGRLRGVMFWELSGDAPDGRLLKSLRTALGTAPSP